MAHCNVRVLLWPAAADAGVAGAATIAPAAVAGAGTVADDAVASAVTSAVVVDDAAIAALGRARAEPPSVSDAEEAEGYRNRQSRRSGGGGGASDGSSSGADAGEDDAAARREAAAAAAGGGISLVMRALAVAPLSADQSYALSAAARPALLAVRALARGVDWRSVPLGASAAGGAIAFDLSDPTAIVGAPRPPPPPPASDED